MAGRILSLVLCLSALLHSAKCDYTVAAVQYACQGQWNQAPADIVATNLAQVEKFIVGASQQNADIVVFPEGTIGWILGLVNNTRDGMLPFCETIPSPENFRDITAQSNPVLYAVRGWAQTHNIAVVMNLCEVEYCTASSSPLVPNAPPSMTSSACPSDGRFQFNVDVVIDSKGELLAKARKSHLYGEANCFDQAPPTPVSFELFGVKFGVLICFEMMFSEPTLTLLRNGVDNFIFSSWWANIPPLTVATQHQQSFSWLYGVTMVAANTAQYPYSSGGGVYHNGAILVDQFEGLSDPSQGLLMASVPSQSKKQPPSVPAVIESTPTDFTGRTDCVNAHSLDVVNCSAGNFRSGVCLSLPQNLQSSSACLTVGNITCSIDYMLSGTSLNSENWVLYATQEVMHLPATPDGMFVELCQLARCEHSQSHSSKGQSVACNAALQTSTTVFKSFTIEAALSPNTRPFPMFALDSASIQDPSALVITAQPSAATEGDRDDLVTHKMQSSAPIAQAMFSAGFFGVRS